MNGTQRRSRYRISSGFLIVSLLAFLAIWPLNRSEAQSTPPPQPIEPVEGDYTDCLLPGSIVCDIKQGACPMNTFAVVYCINVDYPMDCKDVPKNFCAVGGNPDPCVETDSVCS